jgi:hypothetical protein
MNAKKRSISHVGYNQGKKMSKNESDELKKQIQKKIDENRIIKKDKAGNSIGYNDSLSYSQEDRGIDRKIIKVQRREEWPEPPKKDK